MEQWVEKEVGIWKHRMRLFVLSSSHLLPRSAFAQDCSLLRRHCTKQGMVSSNEGGASESIKYKLIRSHHCCNCQAIAQPRYYTLRKAMKRHNHDMPMHSTPSHATPSHTTCNSTTIPLHGTPSYGTATPLHNTLCHAMPRQIMPRRCQTNHRFNNIIQRHASDRGQNREKN